MDDYYRRPYPFDICIHIICHDYSWIVGKNYYHEVLGGKGRVSIGNNVFIGTEAIALMNSEIGDNLIIGTQSVESGGISSDCVAAGSTAKPIMLLEDYWKKEKQNNMKKPFSW